MSAATFPVQAMDGPGNGNPTANADGTHVPLVEAELGQSNVARFSNETSPRVEVSNCSQLVTKVRNITVALKKRKQADSNGDCNRW